MNQLDPQWLDGQYNNRARIPEHPQLFERWRHASVLARSALRLQADLPYGTLPSQTMDVFQTDRDDAPALIFIHGGYWRSLDKSDHSFIAPAFVADGVHVLEGNKAGAAYAVRARKLETGLTRVDLVSNGI